jgi:Nif-specific regulatory protein
MNPRVCGISGPFQGATFSLAREEISIGRDPSNQLWIQDPALSRQHCLLTQRGDQFTLRDLGSRNGTIVNGMTVDEVELQHGDQICMGTSVLIFLLEGGEEDLRRNRVEFKDTMALGTSPVLLQPEVTFDVQSGELLAPLPLTERGTGDLNSLLKLATRIGGIWDLESLQWQLLGFIFDVVPAERGAILLFERPDEFSSTVAWDRVHGPDCSVQVSRTIVQRVARERVGLVVNDIITDGELRQVHTLVELGIRSVLCVPLIAGDKVLGTIYLDSQHKTNQFDENRLQMVTAVAAITALALRNVQHMEQLRKENQELRAEINLEHNMVGGSQGIRKVFQLVRRVAPTDSTVLIEGESGTGKELVARAIHRNSPRAERPFVAINCAAIPDTLLESELFGHEKGAFTGANALKKGKLEAADGGTLFFDEIGELAAGLQAKLLRVLQEREFERVGGTRPVKLDIRVIAATNRSLTEFVKTGAFRNDLYHRLNVVSLTVPALRERRDDIPVLAEYFISKISRKCKIRPKSLSPEARAYLTNYPWPGNIRELENALEHAIVLGSTNAILPEDLPEAIVETAAPTSVSNAQYHLAMKNFKKELVRRALRDANGSYLDAAKALGMHPNSLLRLIRNLDLRSSPDAGLPSAAAG